MEAPYYSIYNPDSLCEAGASTHRHVNVDNGYKTCTTQITSPSVTIHYVTISLSERLPFLLVYKVKRSRYKTEVIILVLLKTAMEVKHEHFRYVIGQQPRKDTMVVQKSKLGSCPQIIQDDNISSLGYFQRVAGTKKFCTYVLVYHHTTPQSKNP